MRGPLASSSAVECTLCYAAGEFDSQPECDEAPCPPVGRFCPSRSEPAAEECDPKASGIKANPDKLANIAGTAHKNDKPSTASLGSQPKTALPIAWPIPRSSPDANRAPQLQAHRA